MKGLIVLVALGCMLGASAVNLRSETKPTELGMKTTALNALKTAIEDNNAKSKELIAQCGEEKSEATKWAEEGAVSLPTQLAQLSVIVCRFMYIGVSLYM